MMKRGREVWRTNGKWYGETSETVKSRGYMCVCANPPLNENPLQLLCAVDP